MSQRSRFVSAALGAWLVASLATAGPGCSSSNVAGDGDIAVVDTGGDDVQRPDGGDVSVPTCTSNADCLGVFGDLGPCRVAVCDTVAGVCQNAAKKDYILCEDGDVCTRGSVCISGECTGGAAVVCNDGNACTADRCDPLLGCVNEPQTGGACDDGDPCTADDTCQDGVCAGPPGDTCPCTADADCAAYEDGDLCNGTLACYGGRCQVDPATRVVCDTSGDPTCRVTACVPETGACVQGDAPAGAACDDGNGCTVNDACAAGVCVGGENRCACTRDADCNEFEDGNRCNGTLRCSNGGCVVDAATIVTCQQPADACLTAVCLPATGACQSRARPDGTTCNDGDPCTTGDRCVAGACGGAQRRCDDGDACTTDSCDAATGQCRHVATDCDDGNPCTSDRCNPTTGACENVAIFCEQPGGLCRFAECVPEEGGCVVRSQADGTVCDDGNACTAGDVCTNGECAGARRDCDDGDACTIDDCDAVTGQCTHVARVCPDDGDPCTLERCDAATGTCGPVAAPNGTACSDDNPCTQADTCQGGVCVGGAVQPCDDGVACTVDSCDPATGACVHDASGCPTGEICDNDVDDDEDGLTDCADTLDCADHPACQVTCAPDALEEDDTRAEATLATGDDTFTGLTSEYGDDDWFAIPVCAGGLLGVTATFAVQGGDIDLFVFTEDGDNPAWAISAGDDERLDWTADVDGTIWLQVAMFTPDACNSYALSITFDDTGCGGVFEDCFDGADNDGDGRADCADSDCSGVVSIPGACTNDADLRAAATADVTVIGPTCILDRGCGADVACNTACVRELTGVSADCAGCGGALAACVFTRCALSCIDVGSAACASCIETQCFPDYVACFGVLHCDFEYDCEGGADDDGDGLVDCDDPDCAGVPACVVPEDCANGVDDDGDGLTDCDDVDCVDHPACQPPPPEVCDNERDDDGDGHTDCDDVDCALDPACLTPPPEDCDNGRDDDGDGHIDCDDVDCALDPACLPPPPEDCTNNVDDDRDGDTDCDDTDCDDHPACAGGPEDCFDRIDNDGDGLVDCADPECSAAVTREGACTNPADLPIAGRVDVMELGQSCIIDAGCLNDVACNTRCIQAATGLSAGCATCGGELAACVVERCLLSCADTASPACADCIARSCYPGYVECFGLLHCAFEYVCDNGVSDDEDALVDCADPDCAGDPACAPCVDDAREPNDDMATATVAVPTALFQGLVSAGGDEDWFAVQVCSRGLLAARAVYDTTAGAVDLAILTADGTVRATSTAVANGRRVQWLSTVDGTVYVRLRQPAADGCLPYDLGVTLDRTNCAGTPERCDDGIDNDRDGATDCDDPDCATFPACLPPVEDCDNGVDDDGDGAVDCRDADCAADPACQPGGENCFDGVDNDGDGRADCRDSDCSAAVSVEGACTNDADLPIAGRLDIQALGRACILGEGCLGDVTCNTLCVQERTGVSLGCAACGGGLAACVWTTCAADCAVPDSLACAACVEDGCWPDYVACFGLLRCPFETVCGDRLDDDGDGLVDCADPDCEGQAPCVPAAEICDDFLDNDGDGEVDCADADCLDAVVCQAAACGGDDRFEDNDTRGGATDAGMGGTFSGLVVTLADEDWFRVPVCVGGQLSLFADFTHLRGDIDMALIGPGGGNIRVSQSSTDDESITWTSTVRGNVFVRMYLYPAPTIDATCNTYDLTVRFDQSGCAARLEDCFDGVDNDGDGRADCADSDCSAAVSVPGSCTNRHDLRAVAGADISALALYCILTEGCFADPVCNTRCIADATGASTACASCGGDAAVCAVTTCLGACALDPGSAACDACLDERCWPAYQTCFGTLRCGFELSCTGGVDDDGDGLVDCADPDCAGVAPCL